MDGIEPNATPAICCGPNIVNFSRLATLREMVDHIYGQGPGLTQPGRPHMFLREIGLYVDYLRGELEKFSLELSTRKRDFFEEFRLNLLDGIDYYQGLAEKLFNNEWELLRGELAAIRDTIEALALEPVSV